MDHRLSEDEISRDYFYKKKVVVFQSKKGYRFSVDAPILADFLPHCPRSNALDIGTGCGIVSLLALFKNKFAHIEGIEIQEKLSRLACLNAEQNGFSSRFRVRHADLKDVYRDYDHFMSIFSNPPFMTINLGRLSPSEEVRVAKTEEKLTVQQLLELSYSLLGETGSLFLILPFSRYRELLEFARNIGLFVSKIRKVFSFKDGNPDRFLVQLTNYNTISEELTPLVIFKNPGVYTEEMEHIFSGS